MIHRLRFNPFAGFVALLVLAVAALSACTTLGLNQPRTAEDGLRYGQAVATGAYKTLTQAVQSGQLSGAEARPHLNTIDEAEARLADADKVISALPSGAAAPVDTVAKINAAVAALNVVADILRSRLPSTSTTALPAKQTFTLAPVTAAR